MANPGELSSACSPPPALLLRLLSSACSPRPALLSACSPIRLLSSACSPPPALLCLLPFAATCRRGAAFCRGHFDLTLLPGPGPTPGQGPRRKLTSKLYMLSHTAPISGDGEPWGALFRLLSSACSPPPPALLGLLSSACSPIRLLSFPPALLRLLSCSPPPALLRLLSCSPPPPALLRLLSSACSPRPALLCLLSYPTPLLRLLSSACSSLPAPFRSHLPSWRRLLSWALRPHTSVSWKMKTKRKWSADWLQQCRRVPSP